MSKTIKWAAGLIIIAAISVFVILAMSNAFKPVPIANMANPWATCSSIKDAEAKVGFSIDMPFEPSHNDTIRVLENKTVEISHMALTNGYTFRKSSDKATDITGDYAKYPYEKKVDGVTYKGQNENEIKDMTWQKGRYSYALMFDNAVPLAEAQKFVV